MSLGSWNGFGPLSHVREKFLTSRRPFYPWASVQGQTFTWCSTWANAPSRPLSTPSHDLGVQPGPSCFQESTSGTISCLTARLTHRVAVHCLLSQLTGTAIWTHAFPFFFFPSSLKFIFFKVCFRWQCQASGDTSGDSFENIRKAINTVLGIISVTQIKSRVSILPTHLWGFGASVKIWINPLLQKKKIVPVHN